MYISVSGEAWLAWGCDVVPLTESDRRLGRRERDAMWCLTKPISRKISSSPTVERRRTEIQIKFYLEKYPLNGTLILPPVHCDHQCVIEQSRSMHKVDDISSYIQQHPDRMDQLRKKKISIFMARKRRKHISHLQWWSEVRVVFGSLHRPPPQLDNEWSYFIRQISWYSFLYHRIICAFVWMFAGLFSCLGRWNIFAPKRYTLCQANAMSPFKLLKTSHCRIKRCKRTFVPLQQFYLLSLNNFP